MPPEGSSETTTSIGGRCKARKRFSRPVLISREAWPVYFLDASTCVSSVSSRLSSLIGVALAEGKHLFPFRTEKLSPPAPMVLPGRLGGRVGRRPLFITKPRPGNRSGLSYLWSAGVLRNAHQVGVPPDLRTTDHGGIAGSRPRACHGRWSKDSGHSIALLAG